MWRARTTLQDEDALDPAELLTSKYDDLDIDMDFAEAKEVQVSNKKSKEYIHL